MLTTEIVNKAVMTHIVDKILTLNPKDFRTILEKTMSWFTPNHFDSEDNFIISQVL